jgi:HEAT repeat protein
MDLKQVLELLGKEHAPGDEMTGAFLEDAVAGFASNPVLSTNSIRQLQASDPRGFVLAAVRMLTTREEKSPGVQYVAGLMFAGNLLLDALIDKRTLGLEAAISLARNLASAEPLLDARLVGKILANAAGDIRAVEVDTALRVLALVDEISDCSRLSSYLVQLMRHPSAHVRSKATLLLGRANLNLSRIKGFLASDDARVRANAVESLWGLRDQQVLGVLREASRDKHGRVAINALVGLCKAGEGEAHDRLKWLAESTDTAMRAGAAWAMGELANPEDAATLTKLERDADEKVRKIAARSLKKLTPPAPAKPAVDLKPAADDHNAADHSVENQLESASVHPQ